MTLAPTSPPRPLVLVSWDGRSQPLRLLQLDATPAFDLLLFDYSGAHSGASMQVQGLECAVLAAATQCKGQIYALLAQRLLGPQPAPQYVALIDDDVLLSVSGINRALHIAFCEGLDLFAPSLSHDSVFTHRWTLHRAHRLFHRVDWIEVMMPFYRGELFRAGAAHYAGNVSSWGIDKYLMPTLQRLLDMPLAAVVDEVMASHRRPITSGNKVYANGLTAAGELERMRLRCMELVRAERPQWVGDAWYRRTFERRHAYSPGQRLTMGVGRTLREWLDRST